MSSARVGVFNQRQQVCIIKSFPWLKIILIIVFILYRKLAEQLLEVECEFSHTKHLLTESQMRNDELQCKIKETMLEMHRYGKLLEEKEKEREEMTASIKKLAECTCRLRSNNISMGAELCQHK